MVELLSWAQHMSLTAFMFDKRFDKNEPKRRRVEWMLLVEMKGCVPLYLCCRLMFIIMLFYYFMFYGALNMLSIEFSVRY